jgi:hypothetical protein
MTNQASIEMKEIAQDILTSKEEGLKLVNIAIKSDHKALAELVKAGIYAAYHGCQYGDCSLLNELYKGVRPSTALSITKFVSNVNGQFGVIFSKNAKQGFSIAGDNASEEGKIVRAKANEARAKVDYEALANVPWLSDKDKDAIEAKMFDVLNASAVLFAKIEKESKKRELSNTENVIYTALKQAQVQLANISKAQNKGLQAVN